MRFRRPDGAKKLGHNRVEPIDLSPRDVDRVLQLALVCRRFEFFHFPLHQLKMDMEGIERIADFVGHPGGEQGKGRQTFRFDRLLGRATVLRDVAQDHGVPNGLRHRPVRCPR